MAYNPTASRAIHQSVAASVPKHDRVAALQASGGAITASSVAAPAGKGSTATGKVNSATVTVPAGKSASKR